MTAKTPVLIANPRSGAGRAESVISYLRRTLFHGRPVEVLLTERTGHAREWTSRLPRDCPMLIVVGGDGTLNEVVTGLIEGRGRASPLPPIGLIPTGTANCLAHELHISTDLRPAAEVIQMGKLRKLDLGTARLHVYAHGRPGMQGVHQSLKPTERYFLCMAGAGFDAQVTRAYQAVRGPRSYAHKYLAPILSALKNLTLPKIRVEIDGHMVHPAAATVVIGNTRTYGIGMRVTPNALPDDGVLDVCAFTARRRRDFVRTIVNVLLGRHIGQRDVHYHVGRTIALHAEEPVPVELDGDFVGYLPLQVSIQPGAVCFFAP